MGPENEGKPAGLSSSSRMVEVRHEVLEEIEGLLVKTQGQMDHTWASDLLCRKTLPGENATEADESHLEALRVLTTKQDNMKLAIEVALLKLRSLMSPRQPRASEEDLISNSKLKRGSPLAPIDGPRLPGIPGLMADTKFGALVGSEQSANQTSHSAGFDTNRPSPLGGEMLPLKFIRTGDNTKAPFQKPSTIFMPTPKLGVPIDPSTVTSTGDLVPSGGLLNLGAGIMKPTPNGLNSPPKKSSRSRRDRSKTRSKLAAMPEPLMVTLQPGDPNKIPEDGYLWRKYGNKPIKTASYKRGYYKCRHFKEVRCMATKIVQQTDDCPSTFSVSYKGEHTCMQGKQGGLSSGSRPSMGGLDSTAPLADQMNAARCIGTDGAERNELLEGMEWNSGENSSDCASEDMFAPSDIGEDAVESSLTMLEPTPGLIVFDDMPSIATLPDESLSNNGIVDATPDWVSQTTSCDFKEKCPPKEDSTMMALDDSDQLLKMIHFGTYSFDHQPSDINYWYDMVNLQDAPFSSYTQSDLHL